MKLRRLFKERVEISDGSIVRCAVTVGAWFGVTSGQLYVEAWTHPYVGCPPLPDRIASTMLLEDGREFAAAQRAVGILGQYVASVRRAVEEGT